MRALAVLLALAPLACADGANLPVAAGYGPDPALPAPERSLVPTIEVAKARGRASDETPVPAPGFEVAAFGPELEHPRWLYVLPNGDVLVAETNGPPSEAHGFRAWLMQRMKKRAGGAAPSANRITLLRDLDGARLYVAVGSSSNVAENGLPSEEGRAAILEIDRASGRSRIYASGLRNPVGMSWQPESGALWAAVNERDEIGGDLVPDYMTAVQDGGFYGWPFSYYGAHADRRSLGLTFYRGDLLPSRYAGGAFVGQHGSWNRDPMSGYKVIFVPFRAGQPSGLPEDILTGFLDGDGRARGRPVGVAVDAGGALLVADDVGNAVWRVTPSGAVAGR